MESNPQERATEERWDTIADVVVVGFGGAGSAAAIEASDAGADVIVVEKTSKGGGSTRMSGGVVYGAGTSVQRAAGIDDSPDGMYSYWMATGKGLRDPEIVRILANKSGEAIEWLIALGVNFPPDRLYMSGAEREYAHVTKPAARAHVAGVPDGAQGLDSDSEGAPTYREGVALFDVLEQAVRGRNVQILLDTTAEELVVDGRRRVAGVRASSHGNTRLIRARRAVVLADGGFDRNPEMLRKFCPKAPALIAGRVILRGHPGHTGDGIRMGMALGADICDMPNFNAMATPFVPIGPSNPLSPGPRYPSIFVNARGQRFINEDIHYATVAEALDGLDSIAFQVFDDDAKTKIILPDIQLRRLRSASTVKELAVKLEISPEGLEKTVEIWNRFAASGLDPEFGKSGVTVGPIVKAPFHGGALKRRGSVTYGGLRTNAKAQVVDVLHGKPIPGLYAAGQTTGGRLAQWYPGSGSAIMDCVVFGRIAGQQAAAEPQLDLSAGAEDGG